MGLPHMQATPYAIPFLVIGLLMAWLGYVAWRRRCFPGAVPFVFLLGGIAGWTLVNVLEKSLVDHAWRWRVSTFLYFFIVLTPAAWFVFAVRYSRRDRWLTKRTGWLLLLEPAAVLALAVTDGRHGLFRATTRMADVDGLAVMHVTYGPLFWIHVVYSYSLFLAGGAFVLWGLVDRESRRPGRVTVLLAAMLFPAIGNALYVFGLQPMRHTDLTPIYFAITGIGAFWMLFHVRVFDVLPVARDFVLDHMRDAVFVVDKNFRIVDKNRAADGYLGPDGHRTENRPITAWIPSLEPLLRSLEGETRELEISLRMEEHGEEKVRAADRRAESERLGYVPDPNVPAARGREGERLVLARATPMFEGSDLVATLVLLADVTERRRLEEDRRKLEVALLQAQKVESLGVLAGGIAHDFNNLLAAILLNAEMAREEVGFESDLDVNLQGITDAVDRASSLTGQMLAYSGKGRFVLDELDLNQIIVEMRALLEAAVSSAGSLELDLATQSPRIVGDRAQIRQVLVNLVTNAAEALENRTGSIRVRTRMASVRAEDISKAAFLPELQPGVHWMLEVTDTGSGIDEDKLTKIFDPFFSTKFAGRGLGLAAVLGIVRGHGGAIFVESERGIGTDIRVVFPAARSPSPTVAPPRVGSRSRNVEAALRPTVLVVDDEEVVRELARKVLEGAGFRVMTAANGADALWLHERFENQIDVVLVDLTMPVMRGDEVFAKLRGRAPDLPIILSSGFDETSTKPLMDAETRPIFLKKPYHVPDLVVTVQEALARRRADRLVD